MIDDPVVKLQKRVDLYVQGLGWELVSINVDIPEAFIVAGRGPLSELRHSEASKGGRRTYRRIFVEEGIVVEQSVDSPPLLSDDVDDTWGA